MSNYQEVLNLRKELKNVRKNITTLRKKLRQHLKVTDSRKTQYSVRIQRSIDLLNQTCLSIEDKIINIQPNFGYGIKSIQKKLNSFGFKTIDIQQDDTSVGISSGWVIFEDEKSNVLELAYCDAQYYAFKQDYINHSTPCTDV